MSTALEMFVEKISGEDMPMFSQTSKSILDIFSQNNSSLSDMSLCILRDSALTAKVLKIANGVLFGKGSKTTTVSRAVLRLGYKTIKSICISSILIESIKSKTMKNKVVSEMMKAFHAAVQARSVAIAKGESSVEEIFIATLLYRIGHLAFYCFGGILVDKLEEKIKANTDVPPEKIEKEVLGFSLQELSYGLTQSWGLGSLLESCLTRSELNNKNTSVLLGHNICNAIEAGWDSPKMEKCKNTLSRFLNISNDDVSKLIQSSLEESIRSAKDYGLGEYVSYIGESSLTAEQEESLEDPKKYDPVLQLEILSELYSLIKDPKFNLNLYLVSLIEGIARGIGMQRVLFAILSPDKKSFTGRYGIGWPKERIERFDISLQYSSPNIFGELLRSREAAWVNGNRNKWSRYLTQEVRARTETQHFFVAPIVIKGVVIGAICADCSIDYELLDEKKFVGFQYFVNTSNDVLTSLY